jgi:hypothetical protein
MENLFGAKLFHQSVLANLYEGGKISLLYILDYSQSVYRDRKNRACSKVMVNAVG